MEKVSGSVAYEFEVRFVETVDGDDTLISLITDADAEPVKGLTVKIPTDLWTYEPIKTIIRVMLKDRLQEALSVKVKTKAKK